MKALKTLKIIALLEGISLLLLLCIAMPLKYIYGKEHATQDIGMAHGILFIVYCILVLIVGIDRKWSTKVMILSLIASVIPAGTFVVDHKYFK